MLVRGSNGPKVAALPAIAKRSEERMGPKTIMQEHISEGQAVPTGAEAGAVVGAQPSVGGRTQATAGEQPQPAAPARARRRGEPIRTVSERLHIHPETLRTWCSEGRLGDFCYKDPESRAWMITSEGIRGIQAGRLPFPRPEAAAKPAMAEQRAAPAKAAKKVTAKPSRAKFLPIDQFVQQVDWRRTVERWCSQGQLGDVCRQTPAGQWELKQSAIRQMSAGTLIPTPAAPKAAQPTPARGAGARAPRAPTPIAAARGQGARMVAGGRGAARHVARGRG